MEWRGCVSHSVFSVFRASQSCEPLLSSRTQEQLGRTAPGPRRSRRAARTSRAKKSCAKAAVGASAPCGALLACERVATRHAVRRQRRTATSAAPHQRWQHAGGTLRRPGWRSRRGRGRRDGRRRRYGGRLACSFPRDRKRRGRSRAPPAPGRGRSGAPARPTTLHVAARRRSGGRLRRAHGATPFFVPNPAGQRGVRATPKIRALSRRAGHT